MRLKMGRSGWTATSVQASASTRSITKSLVPATLRPRSSPTLKAKGNQNENDAFADSCFAVDHLGRQGAKTGAHSCQAEQCGAVCSAPALKTKPAPGAADSCSCS